MEQRQLGDSGLYTSAIGFGTWEMSTTMYGHIDVGEAAQAVNSAIDHGITLFDTAEVYGPYHSERLLAKALGNKRQRHSPGQQGGLPITTRTAGTRAATPPTTT